MQPDVTFTPIRSEKDTRGILHIKETDLFHSFNLDEAPQSVHKLLFVRS